MKIPEFKRYRIRIIANSVEFQADFPKKLLCQASSGVLPNANNCDDIPQHVTSCCSIEKDLKAGAILCHEEALEVSPLLPCSAWSSTDCTSAISLPSMHSAKRFFPMTSLVLYPMSCLAALFHMFTAQWVSTPTMRALATRMRRVFSHSCAMHPVMSCPIPMTNMIFPLRLWWAKDESEVLFPPPPSCDLRHHCVTANTLFLFAAHRPLPQSSTKCGNLMGT